jgi:CheY-like chemotaxis protein/anti-sigma regulatory factor (Ser/Thr protein kinase)
LEHVIQICLDDARTGGVELIRQFDASHDLVEGDEARLQQVFWNLIKNAIKFTMAGGCVRITTTNVGQELLLTVQDTGAGIAPEVLPRIFNAFEQGGAGVTRTFGGLGLGLAISKAIVDLHHGRISAQSEGLTRGATFSIALPLRIPVAGESAVARPVARPAADEINQPRSLRILLVDDNADTLRTLRKLLAMRGMQVTTATRIEEALHAITESKFDLVISDIGLPDGSGCDLMKKLRKIQTIPAIALSGYGMENDIQRSLDAGFTAHLVKPVSFEELERVIAEIT